MKKLPIDLIHNTNPPKFRWTQTVQVMGCNVLQECEGMLPPSCEQAIVETIAMVKQLTRENEKLKARLNGAYELIANASKRAEATIPPVQGHPQGIQVTPLKKGR